MGVTVIGGGAESIYGTRGAIVEIKQQWSDEWEFHPELEVEHCSRLSNAHGESTCTIRRRYGHVKQPWEVAMPEPTLPRYLPGWWVRVSIYLDSNTVRTLFIGQILGDGRTPQNVGHDVSQSEVDTTPAGDQQYVAHGPERWLRRIDFYESVHNVSGVQKTVGWIPDMNTRGRDNVLRGNRATSAIQDVYHYGGEELWNHRQYIEYLLSVHLPDVGPRFTLIGDIDTLEGLQTSIRMPASLSLGEALSKLIAPEFGLDYVLRPDESATSQADRGFVIDVFATTAQEFSFSGATLPKNPSTVRFDAPWPKDWLRLQMSADGRMQYSSIRVVGNRIVVCCTLKGTDDDIDAKWTGDLEDEYKDPPGLAVDATIAERDRARFRDRYRPVYQQIGAPADWNFNGGAASIELDLEGNLSGAADTQVAVRRTLPWIPLREGIDYGATALPNGNPAGFIADLRPPLVLLLRDDGTFIPATRARVSVSVAQQDFGVYLSSNPNHLLGDSHFDPVTDGSAIEPEYNYANSAITFAYESDQRVVIGVDLPNEEGDGTTLVLQAPDAEFWYLASNTYVDVDDEGQVILSGAGQVVRDDTPDMAMMLAGAMSRYWVARGRAVVTIAVARPWADLLGKILTTVEHDGYSDEINAPITGVSWTFEPEQQMTVHTGFAQ